MATGPAVKLQILVPGETAVPGSPTGKTSVAITTQTSEVYFPVTVNVVASNPCAGGNDTTVPTVSITNPTANETVSGTTPIAANASEPKGGILATAIFQGFAAGTGYWLAGIPHAGFFGMLTSLVSFVPGVGTSLVVISAVTHSGEAALRRYGWVFLPLIIAALLGYSIWRVRDRR